MQSIFARIYMGMLLAVVAIVLLVFLATYYVNKSRITEHVNQYYSGTFKLIGEGVSRHQNEQRTRWLNAIEKLSDLKFESFKLSQWPHDQQLFDQLIDDKFVFQVDHSLSQGKVFILVANQSSYLEVNLSDFGGTLVRVSAFLMLNELGRHSTQERAASLKKIRMLFEYPIQIKALNGLNISSSDIRNIEKGNISVVLNSSTSSNASMMAYAPLGNSSYALVLGKIPFFDWFPQYLIFIQIAFILILMATSSFLLVRPLEKRLKQVDRQVDNVGLNRKLSINPEQSSDAIGQLSNTVNSMAIRIERLLEAQNEMVGAISHELRTPISRIRFRMAVVEEFKDRDLVEQSAGVEQDLSELEKLIDEVITFSKLKRDKPVLQIEEIQMESFFEQLVSATKVVSQKISVQITSNENNYLVADYRYLNRALENLLINAQKYAKSKIELGFSKSKTLQHIWVSDDGKGILKQDRLNIFEPFARLDASRARKSGGYGLGLAIVKQIAEWHCGKVEALESELGGAKIIISWPIDLSQRDNNS